MAHHWLAGEHRAVVVDGAPVGVTGWARPGSACCSRAAGTAPRPAGHRAGTARVRRADGVRRLLGCPPPGRPRRVRDRDRLAGLPVQAGRRRRPATAAARPDADPGDAHRPRLPGVHGLAGRRRLLRRPQRDERRQARRAGGRHRRARAARARPVGRRHRDVRRPGAAPPRRRRSILALTAREVLAQGRTPVAGCWWKNWPSRVTLEAAGLTCAGTIFRLDLDPDLFADRWLRCEERQRRASKPSRRTSTVVVSRLGPSGPPPQPPRGQ